MDYQFINIEYKNVYTELWLSRPVKKNALNIEMIDEINDFLSGVNTKNSSFLIIRGKGDVFCSGADLNEFTSDNRLFFIQKLSDMLSNLYNLKIPLISVVHGKVYGGALGMLAVSDIVLVEKNTEFCFSEVKLGLVPAVILPYLDLRINKSAIQYLILSAKVFNVEYAVSIGLVHEIIHQENNKNPDIFLKQLAENNKMAMIKAKELLKKIGIKNNLNDKSNMALNFITKLLNDNENISQISSYLNKKI